MESNRFCRKPFAPFDSPRKGTDLLAARALGPSSFLALLSLEYCVFPLRPVFFPSDTHPSTSWRLEVVSRFLRRLHRGKDYLRSERDFYGLANLYSLERSVPDEESASITMNGVHKELLKKKGVEHAG